MAVKCDPDTALEGRRHWSRWGPVWPQLRLQLIILRILNGISMVHTPSKDKLRDVNQQRDFLIHSLRERLLPAFMKLGFEVAPLVHRGPADSELVRSLSLGRLRRHREGRVDLVQIQFARYRRAAFRIATGVAPPSVLITVPV